MNPSLSHEDFSARLGEPFRVTSSAAGVALRLIRVDAGTRAPAAPGLRQPFSLLFRGPTEPVLTQRLYTLDHGGLGTVEIFIVPVGPDADGMCYEAVFS